MIEPVDLTLDAAVLDDDEEGDRDTAGGSEGAGRGRAPGVAFHDGRTPPAGAKRGAAGPKGGAAPAKPSAAPAKAPEEGPGITLAADIEAVIDACRREIETAAKVYYAALYPDQGKPAGKGAKAKPTTPKGGKKGTGAAAPSEVPQPVRPIRYPNRIPPSLEMLMANTDKVGWI